jgi:hypothetical protein
MMLTTSIAKVYLVRNLKLKRHSRLARDIVILAAVLAACLILASGCCRFVDYMADGLCGTTIQNEAVSPNRQLKAVAYLYDCGATTDYDPEMVILNADEKLPESPHFRGDFIGNYGSTYIDVMWQSDMELVLCYEQRSEPPVQQPDDVKGVHIRYTTDRAKCRPM